MHVQNKNTLQGGIDHLQSQLGSARLHARTVREQCDSLHGQLKSQVKTMESEREKAQEDLQVLSCSPSHVLLCCCVSCISIVAH